MAREATIAREGNANPINAQRNGFARTNKVESFLSTYKPKDSFFTSNAEIKKITNALGLDKKNNQELTETRNNVVRYYSSLGREYMNSMQSVTAVIDYVKVRKYGIGSV